MFFFLISFFIFSDHGLRLSKYAYETELARREKKLPFISINIPKKLLNTQYFSNAIKNKDRLISFYDVYQTIRHFLYIQKGDSNSTQFSINDKNIHYLRGISLFNEIPINRSCNDALIPENHCSCLEGIEMNEKNFEKEFNIKFDNVIDFILNQVNNITSHLRSVCSEFKKSKLKNVNRLSILNKNLFNFVVEFQPGDAWFEAMIEIKKLNGKMEALIENFGKFSRISIYGNQSYCIDDSYLKNFCFCKNPLER